ncbi:suppressor of tumorigenicity 7 protein-like, partial [Limulus polyphemus]|uniref:Protein ST7 homolog n=1 Tax=Limulus polyphemus TaxID=6850 RepID=A0ABM1BXM6_LIMPO
MAGESMGYMSTIKSWISWSWTYLWILWFILVIFLIYALRGPLRISENITMASMFLNTLTPKFYVALTGTSSLISGLILIFEWWYFRKYGTSFIEQVSLNHISPWLGGGEPNGENGNSNGGGGGGGNGNQQATPECKVWRNPLSLFRGSEYNRFQTASSKEPLTYYDMNLSAQDHQTFFTCEYDAGKPEYESNCATAYILLAEEEATTIIEAEKLFKQALKVAETQYRKSQQLQHQTAQYDALRRRDTNVLVYIRRRLAMCARKLGKLREAVKMMRDVRFSRKMHSSNSHVPLYCFVATMLGTVKEAIVCDWSRLGAIKEAATYGAIKEAAVCDWSRLGAIKEADSCEWSRLGAIKEADSCDWFRLGAIKGADSCDWSRLELLKKQILVIGLDISLPKSATICYTAALLKARGVSDKFSPDIASKRGLSTAEMNAVEAIHRAVEFNPHVPKYLLETKSLILPPEHILKRGDSEAIAYAFFHLPHWKKIEGALNLLHCTWEGTFRMIPYPLEKGYLFYPYPTCTETIDRELLP